MEIKIYQSHQELELEIKIQVQYTYKQLNKAKPKPYELVNLSCEYKYRKPDTLESYVKQKENGGCVVAATKI